MLGVSKLLALLPLLPTKAPKVIMLSQEQFVDACLRYYKHHNLEPGNPFHGEWEKAHYPIPRRLGGEKCVWLLKNHHAIQGVIQSEELGLCCVAWWEGDFLPAFYVPYYKKWRHQHQVDNAGKFWDKMDEEGRRRCIQKMVEGQKWSKEKREAKAILLQEARSNPVLEQKRVDSLVRKMGHKIRITEGDKTNIYPSVRQAAKAMGMKHQHLHKLLRGKEKLVRRGKVIERVRETAPPTP